MLKAKLECKYKYVIMKIISYSSLNTTSLLFRQFDLAVTGTVRPLFGHLMSEAGRRKNKGVSSSIFADMVLFAGSFSDMLLVLLE